jgi:hypothetical protein
VSGSFRKGSSYAHIVIYRIGHLVIELQATSHQLSAKNTCH